jgi:hypothetical protein
LRVKAIKPGPARSAVFGRRFLRIRQRSYSACIVSHERAVILRNAANRIANSGLIDALPLTTREIAVRVIPSFSANSFTEIPPSSRRTVSFNISPTLWIEDRGRQAGPLRVRVAVWTYGIHALSIDGKRNG